ncbi:LINE-1 reverse transcriptase homolog, partial [Linum perenne]
DQNTKFFHVATIQRKSRNSITKLKDDNGAWIDDHQSIERNMCDFFKRLFRKRNDVIPDLGAWDLPTVVTREMNERLSRDISDEEIKQAIFQLGASKAPGPDGFSGAFFRKMWTLVGSQINSEVKGFFRTGCMHEGWNDTNITLIPKVPNPKNISQFRPINCCNFKYKIISKILSSRLKEFIPTIVTEMQSAFSGDRAIQDNIIIVHEVLHNFKTRSKRGGNWNMLIKMDMKKAYDMVEWDCLDQTLRALGFNDVWCGWIRACVQTVRFSVLLNGALTDQFYPSRGIRQGDPISPFLFILLTNSLSRLIQKGVSTGTLKRLKLNKRCPTLTHILFADDTILFGDASVSEADEILKTMREYEHRTAQEINIQKSTVIFSRNTPPTLQSIIRRRLGFENDPTFGKYLGVPSEWGKSKKEMVATMLTRMENLCQSWKSQLLSYAGKETMLKVVL